MRHCHQWIEVQTRHGRCGDDEDDDDDDHDDDDDDEDDDDDYWMLRGFPWS